MGNIFNRSKMSRSGNDKTLAVLRGILNEKNCQTKRDETKSVIEERICYFLLPLFLQYLLIVTEIVY